MNIAGKLQQITIFIHNDRFEPALEHMPGALTLYIVIHGIRRVELLHDLREIRMRRFKQQMIMVAHQTPGIEPKFILFFCCRKIVEEFDIVLLAEENLLAVVAAAGYVVQDSLTLQPVCSCHENSVSRHCNVSTNFIFQGLTPFFERVT